MRQASFAPGSRRPLRRAAMWIGILSLLLSLLTPIIQLHDVAAQGDPPDCDPGYVVDEALGECVEDPNAQLQPQCDEGEIYSEDQGGCVPDPALQPECDEGQVYDDSYGGCVPDPNQEADPVGVQVEKYDCSGLDFDPYTASLDDLMSNCDDNQTSVQLTVGSDAGEQGSSTTGYTEWTDLPAGSGYVYEDIPEGYGEPVVWCGVYVPNEYQPSPSQYGVQNGNAIGWQLEPGEYLYCWWFNVYEDGGTSWIDFYKYECAWDTATDEDAGYYQQECQPREGWDFDVQWDGGGSTQTTDGSGLASWEGVPTGTWTGSESVPEGYGQPKVYCRFVEWPDEAGYDDDWFPYDPSGGEITYEFEYDNVRIECWWFNFLPEGGEGGNWVDLYKYECASDAPHDEGKDYYEQECQPVAGWDLDVQWDGGSETKATGDDGGASWSGLPQGEWVGSETLPEGYGEPLVWCRYVEWPDEASYNQDWEPFLVQGGGDFFLHTFEYEAGVRIECHIYNFAPDGEGSWIEFYKYDCPEGTGYDTDASTLAEECALASDYTFTVESGAYNEDQTTDDSGYATWSGVPTGTYSVTEDLPEGYGDPIVYCRYTEWSDAADLDDSTFFVDASGGQWSGDFEWDGTRIVCGIFNIPGTGSWIDFYKYECAFDEATDQEVDYYQQECQAVADWDFDVQWDGGGSTQTTDGSGLASWQGVPTGTWTGSETLPEGYGEPLVWCRYVEWPDEAGYDNDWFSYDPQDGAFSHNFEYDGVRIECWWFNFATGDTNWIDFYKYWCPTGTTYDGGVEYYVEECTLYTDGVPFDITWEGGGASGTTDGEGYYGASDVPTGAWQAQETIPEGYGDPVVFCRYVEWPEESDVNGDWAMYEAPGGVHENAFGYGGMRIECYWFNIEFEWNWIDVTKWWCAETVTMPYEQSADNLAEECERYTEGVDLTLDYTGGSETLTTDSEGNAEWSQVPPGPWSLHEDVPEGYGDPVVWCRWVEWPEGEDLTNDPVAYGAPAGSFSGEFAGGGYRLHCDIFNIVDYDPGWVTVYKWYCAIGIPTDSSAEYLRDECDLVTTGVDFSLHYGETSAPMTTDTEGKAEWSEVPQGEWTLEETSSTSYGEPIVWCQWVDWPPEADASYTQDLYQPEVTDARVTGSHEYPGMRLVCYWFNFGYEGGDHEILIYKYWCAPGSAWGDDLDAWRENCPETSDGVSFTLANESGSYPQATSGGSVEWTDVQGGDFTVQEAVPAGYEEPRLWCYRYEYEEGTTPALATEDFEPFSVPEGLWQSNIGEGSWRIVCYWFNIAGDENTFTVYKYNCEYVPEGFNTLDEWLDACPAAGNDVDFTLDYTGGSEAMTTAGGKAEWTGVPEGAFTLTEEPSPGYGEPVVWCGWTAYEEGAANDAFAQQVEVPGGIYHGTFTTPGTAWYCYWFNIPDDDSHITVYKYNCPEDVLIENTLDGYQSACTEWGDGIEFTLDNSTGASTQEISGGSATWNDVPQGEFTLTETIPFGYGEPVWWCGSSGYDNGAIFDGFAQLVDAPEGVHTGSIDYDVTSYFCWVFNYPDYDREVTVYKWYCPYGLVPESEDWEDWADTCVKPMSKVSFNLAWDGGSSSKHTNVGGKASWYGSEPGAHTLREQHLPGYEPPVVYCSLEAFFDDGAAYAEAFTPYPVTDNSWSKDLDYAEYKWVCHVYNVPRGPGEITFYKWWCPPGYDVEKWGANPKEECTQVQDGIPFVLDKPVGPNQTQNTGDQVSGGVYFGDLDPGTYVVRETVPPGTAYVFIWDCTGGDIPKVHPKPLTWGNVLNVDVAGGDSIVCNWYNVPEPENGWLTVYKYQCSTKTYVSDVDCETYEFGAEFELFAVDGNASQGTGITSPGGIYTWNDLAEGSYTLDEKDGEPCKVVPSKIDETGNPRVDAGQETVVKVYNCESSTPTPGGKTPGGKVPGKYPNTGVGLDPLPAPVAAIQGDDPDEGEDAGTAEPSGTPTDQEAAAEFYQIACLDTDEGDEQGDQSDPAPATEEPQDGGEGDGGGTAGDDGGLPPFLQPTGDDATDEGDDVQEPDAEATEPATDDEPASEDDATVEECERGAVPERMVIDAADVDHEVEILEIIDGVMQAPTGPNVVSWYKETARLGESSNIVIAAHVNWWNVPEGPFYHLSDLAEGDRVEITGEDGQTYVYEVQWVRQESNLEAPDPEVVGPTGEQSLTLITCGGEWDASISEYNERTVARAVQVEVIPAEGPDTAQAAGIYPLAA